MKLFDYDNPVMCMLSRVWDFVILNVLWIVCCLPVVTIGVSTSAYYYCMLKIVRDTDSGSIAGMFFCSFKQNLKQGILLSLIVIGVTAFLGFDLLICIRYGNSILNVVQAALFFAAAIFGIMVLYVFPVLAQFDNTVKNTMKNALFMGIGNLHFTILLVIISAIPVVLALFFTYYFLVLLPVWILGGSSIIVYLKSVLFVKIFNKYIPKMEE